MYKAYVPSVTLRFCDWPFNTQTGYIASGLLQQIDNLYISEGCTDLHPHMPPSSITHTFIST